MPKTYIQLASIEALIKQEFPENTTDMQKYVAAIIVAQTILNHPEGHFATELNKLNAQYESNIT